MANVKNNASAQDTKRKLIEAAGEVFAKVGFERATIKEITELAGASMAAVNYHFSDKQELYQQVIRHVHEGGLAAMRVLERRDSSATPEQRLRTFVETLLRNKLDPNQPSWQCAIISRELQTPTAAMDRFIKEIMRYYADTMEMLMVDLIGHSLPQRQLALFVNSVMGQCIFYVYNQAFLAKLYPELPPAIERVQELADHITDFSLAAIAGMRKELAAPKRTKAKAKPARKPAAK